MSDHYYSEVDAAHGLRSGLAELKRIEKQKALYQWSLPEHLLKEEHYAAGQIRDAIRFLMADDEDES